MAIRASKETLGGSVDNRRGKVRKLMDELMDEMSLPGSNPYQRVKEPQGARRKADHSPCLILEALNPYIEHSIRRL